MEPAKRISRLPLAWLPASMATACQQQTFRRGNYSAHSTVTVGGSCAFRNVKFTVAPLRTLMTSPGRKQAIHVPPSFRTLG
jgi:hypothetical protein